MSKNIFRVISFAIADFNRNKGIAIASIFVLGTMLLLISGIFFFQGATRYLIAEIENKIDVTAYFKDTVSEEEILAMKDVIVERLPTIKNVKYISKEEAFLTFQERYKNNQNLSNALLEVGINPLLSSINITTDGDPFQYEQVADVLQSSEFAPLIEKVDFLEKRDIIEKVHAITGRINQILIVVSLLLLLVSVLLVFNTIKLAINSSREEIQNMKIVGATDWFIKGPFIIFGGLCGFIACIISLVISGLFAYFSSSYVSFLLPGFSLFGYFLTNIYILALIQLVFGIGICVTSSLFVLKKHLE